MLDVEQWCRYCEITGAALGRYSGPAGEFEASCGALLVGFAVGWRPLRVIHNKRTLRRYEGILGISFKVVLPDEGPQADRSPGYVLARDSGEFWKAVSGDVGGDALAACRRFLREVVS